MSSAGDHSADEAGTAFTTTVNRWYWLDGVELAEPGSVNAVAALARCHDHPERLLPAFDSGDHLHPSDAGYRAIGDAVDLNSLACKR